MSQVFKVECPSCEKRIQLHSKEPFVRVSCHDCETSFVLPEVFGAYQLQDIIANDEATSTHHISLDGQTAVLRRLNSQYKDSQALHDVFIEVMNKFKDFKDDSIVKIASTGEIDSMPYVVFEHYGVESLKKRLASKKFTLLEACYLILDILSSFESSFNQGFVHGNIKPSNIRFDEHDNIRIFDFGLSMALTKELMKEQVSLQFYNNPYYIAPETVARGELTPGSDLYSLGAVFYEIITGKKPFDHLGGIGAMNIKLDQLPEAINHLKPGIPPSLNKVIMDMLSIDAQARPAFLDQIIPVIQEAIEEIESKQNQHEKDPLDQTLISDVGYAASELSNEVLSAIDKPVSRQVVEEQERQFSQMALLGVLFFAVILLAVLYLGLN